MHFHMSFHVVMSNHSVAHSTFPFQLGQGHRWGARDSRVPEFHGLRSSRSPNSARRFRFLPTLVKVGIQVVQLQSFLVIPALPTFLTLILPIGILAVDNQLMLLQSDFGSEFLGADDTCKLFIPCIFCIVPCVHIFGIFFPRRLGWRSLFVIDPFGTNHVRILGRI